jgi:hypothetical protein
MASSDSQTFSGFVTGDKRFEIPPYQRNYSWEKQQVEDLWSDLIEALEMDRDHYIGTFLLMEDEREGETVLQVIDGQQRITTLVILLFELQEQLHDSEAQTTARKIRGEYVARYGTQKLTLAGDDEAFFEREILENISDDDRSGQNEVSVSDVDTDSPSQARLLETKRIFRDRLEHGVPDRLSHDDSTAFYTDLFDKVKSLPLLQYAVDSRSEAARIFQTVNDRGKDLTALEITKSYLMHRVSLFEDGAKADDLIAKIQREFSSIYDSIENIDGPREDQVQRYHFIMWNPDWTSGRGKRYYQDHLDHVKDHFRSVPSADDIMEYVYELQTMFDRLDALINYEDRVDEDRVAERLENLFIAGRLGNFYPLLMVAYEQFKEDEVTEDQLCTLLERIETFIVRTYIIEQKSADTGRSRVYPLARRLYHNAEETIPQSVDPLNIDSVIAKLEKYTDRYCDNDQLESTLGEANVYRYFGGSNRLHELRLLLYVYEASLERKKENIQFDAAKVVSNEKDRFSIEHIWPQTPGDDFDSETKALVKEHTHRLGNLALMTPEDNAAKGNDPFGNKKAAFDESKVRMLERIFENDDWGVEYIDVREQEMLQKIQERWPNEYREGSLLDY